MDMYDHNGITQESLEEQYDAYTDDQIKTVDEAGFEDFQTGENGWDHSFDGNSHLICMFNSVVYMKAIDNDGDHICFEMEDNGMFRAL